ALGPALPGGAAPSPGLATPAPSASARWARAAAYPSTLRCDERETPGDPASAPSGTSEPISDPAAVNASSPTLTGATRVVSTLVLTRLPIRVRCLTKPS